MALVLNGQMQALGGWEQAISSGAWKDATVGAIAGMIAMVPLGLVLMSSVAFAVGGMRLARDSVLVQDLPAVEGLARVDMLCLDKTGTLTEGGIGFNDVHEVGVERAGGWAHALAWFGADVNANSTARCLSTRFTDPPLKQISVVPFSSARKWSAVSFDSDSPAGGTWILGAPEFVLACPPEAAATTSSPLSTLVVAAELAGLGLRTLLLAHSEHPILIDGGEPRLPADVAPVVILTFSEQVRADAAETLSYFREQGVELKVISGDDPRTVAAVARAVGLETVEGYDARELPEDPRALAAVLADQSVFGRVSPKQKARMVEALRENGHVVAMTGDGVNDALAMKQADIGIAMDTSAAVTKSVSRLVLLDGRFDRLPSVVAEGRRVIANIERVSILFLTKTAYAVGLSVIFGALLWQFPFLPRQLSATDGLTIGIPAFFLALMPNTTRYLPGFLKRSLTFAIPAGLIVTGALVTVNAVAIQSGFGVDVSRTASTLTLGTIALWVLVVLSRPLNLRRGLIIVGMFTGLAAVLFVPLLRDFFSLPWPPTRLVITCALTSAAGCLGIELLRRIRRTTVTTSGWKW